MAALLPVWIIGAPFVYLIANWLMAPKTTSFSARTPMSAARPL